MSGFEIEKGLPVPKRKCGRPRLYPFDAMDVGDSFVVANHPAARRAAHAFGMRHGKRFASRTQPDGSVRIWRVA